MLDRHGEYKICFRWNFLDSKHSQASVRARTMCGRARVLFSYRIIELRSRITFVPYRIPARFRKNNINKRNPWHFVFVLWEGDVSSPFCPPRINSCVSFFLCKLTLKILSKKISDNNQTRFFYLWSWVCWKKRKAWRNYHSLFHSSSTSINSAV